ncbi:hypothetical protein CDD80_2765 [Ophiocordyceps camponoti-rufipedis]|uniref:Uncharacterized protein n=1 Tax=Ophiocordyceps camponoti-rufipedis TaxID=2004952 RepID=A0A2C5Z4W4_9HYPO|nr:hypothetical protein CDD80_2765 [Ophiocordyceps camponoti-rufipedis]
MRPTEIADSDASSEASPPPAPDAEPPAHEKIAIELPARSSDGATTSTDPAFFQTVFDEQNEAACRGGSGE